MKSIIIGIVLLFPILSFNQERWKEKDFLSPDTVSIAINEASGCLTAIRYYLRINSYKNEGDIYVINDRTHEYLYHYNIEKTTIDSIIKLIFNYNILALRNNQYDSLKPSRSTGDGGGVCKIFIQKGKNYFEKEINFPIPTSRSYNENFYHYHSEITQLANDLTSELSFKSLIEISEGINKKNLPFDSTVYRNHIPGYWAKVALAHMRDSLQLENFIELYEKSLIDTNFFEYNKISVQVLAHMESETARLYLAESLSELIKNKKEIDAPYAFKHAIIKIENDSLKKHYLKTFLNCDNKILRFLMAAELAMLKDNSGLNILLQKIESDIKLIHLVSRPLVTLNDSSILNKIYNFYIIANTLDIKSDYKKKEILSNYLWILNELMGYSTPQSFDYNPYRFYFDNFDFWKNEIEKRYIEYYKIR